MSKALARFLLGMSAMNPPKPTWLISLTFSWLLVLLTSTLGCGDEDDGTPTTPVPTNPAIALADVSVLLPLPSSRDDESWLRLDATAKGGVLLPTEHLATAIADFQIGASDELAYEHWRIVAARLDPCFPDGALLQTNPAACRRQIRLVAQPVASDPNGVEDFVLTDNAIHLLYDLEEAQFATASAQWKAWAAETPVGADAPLGIHPDLSRDGLGSPLGATFIAMLTANVGEANLSQVTFMFVIGRSSGWRFGGYKVEEGALVPFNAHNTGSYTQELVGVFGTPLEISPSSPLATTLLALAEALPGELAGTPTEVDAAIALAQQIDNPTTMHNPDTVDCVSCHVAGRLRRRGLALGAPDAPQLAYANDTFDLTNTTNPSLVGDATMVRSFGYLGTTMLLSDRVIHESAEVATWLAAPPSE
ncbi:MAG: hypothetical protein IPL79_14875 [Myxococcales bacterium]|nr:hypothetical protein [Myxococcales bacterium]